jgi:hydrogenase maturation protein HypF
MKAAPTTRVGALGDGTRRARLAIHGAVQGVGFRPFVYRLATELGLAGWVNNSSQGVFVEVEGEQARVEEFVTRIETEKPPRSLVQSLETSWLKAVGYTAFEIRPSSSNDAKTALMLPDIATCGDCLREIFDPSARRYRYPFTNCTNCGPRFSIIEALPYDRPNTSMKSFVMCEQCRAEYENPRDRRFHAQPNACPLCGPHVELWDDLGTKLSTHDAAIAEATQAIRAGGIVAVKGLGGFHLIVDARCKEAVLRLRRLKHREEKPMAVIFPSCECAKHQCEVSPLEERLLRSAEAPIVLLRRRRAEVADSVAPNNPLLGVMLPYAPLHHLLLSELGFPVVATSGNLGDEPICTDENEALERLGEIADMFLVHNRPIIRHVDDSIVRVVAGREQVLRRARGFAPLPMPLKAPARTTLAVGAHLKNAVALAMGAQAFISQHIGDLETVPSLAAFQRTIADFERLYEASPELIAADAHPDYRSTKFARECGLPIVSVQHHYAHVLSCMTENELDPPALGVSWDGTGFGNDGTIWGGEFLKIGSKGFERFSHLRSFHLPGGEAAVREPRRAAIGLLFEIFGDEVFEIADLPSVRAFSANELRALRRMIARKLNAPLTSSAGRLFDAVASLIGLRQRSAFEGQPAMELEFALDGVESSHAYPVRFAGMIDWEPAVREIVANLRAGVAAGEIAAKFHNTLVEAIIEVARRSGETCVVLCGGCFQNKYLTEHTVSRLRDEGFRPYWHERLPSNDGGIALGQIVAAMRATEEPQKRARPCVNRFHEPVLQEQRKCA